MKMLVSTLAALLLATVLGGSPAAADGAGSYDADARFAEGAPPVIPHPIDDNASGEVCLSCHQTGLNNAPLCPHPVRVYCTACHVRSELGAPAQGTAKKGKVKGSK
jgi:cytochrome c5